MEASALATSKATHKIEAFLDDKKATISKVETANRLSELVVSAHGKEKTVIDSSKLTKIAAEIPVTARFSTTSSTKAETESVKPQSVDKWDAVKADFSAKAETQRVSEAFENLDRLAKPHLENGTTLKNDQALKDAYAQTQVELTKAYATGLVRNSHVDRTRLASAYNRVVSEQKSIYGYNDNYDPDVYDAIFQRSRSCVGLVHPDKQNGRPHDAWQPNVSGVLIASNLVLTCAHDITDETIAGENIEVWFGFERDLNGQPRPKTVVHVVRIVYDGRTVTDNSGEPLDFALLEIEPVTRTPTPLTTRAVTLGTAIYVVGHPKGEYEAVHDNTHVIFPYEVTEKDYGSLKLGLHAHVLGVSEDSAQLTDDLFNNSYEKVSVSPQKVIYRYFQRVGGEHMPVMGADCDTFHGDSGGGAFLRNSSHCCGILIEGDSDLRTFGVGTFLHHEKILPFRVIDARLSSTTSGLSGWPANYNVNIIR